MSECRIDQLGCVLHGFRDPECKFFNYQHEPPAPRAGERDEWDEWYTDSRRSTDATIYARKGNQWIGQVHAQFADQIVTEHNQHATLIEQRERLINAIRDIAIRSLLYCEQKYDHDDQARLNLEALLATIEQEGEATR